MTRSAAQSAGSPAPRSGSVHWLVRIAERAGYGPQAALDASASAGVRDVWDAIVRGFDLKDQDLAELVADYFHLDVANLGEAEAGAAVVIPEEMARKHHILPIHEQDRQLVVATADPTDVEAERAIGFSTGRTPVFRIASPQAIQDAIDARFSPEKQVESLIGSLGDELDDLDAVKLIEEMGPEAVSEGEVDAAPVVRLTNLILRDGILAGASDIHVEPGRSIGVVRYRVDGVLRKHTDLPMSALNRVISRIKILSKLDITDRLRPQDGKARVQVDDRAYDLRVSTIPAGGSEKCVVRILDSGQGFGLDDLGLQEVELERFRRLIGFRDGIVIVTGPTGSGKTTTLYGALRELADGQINVMTVEDPIEYELPSITQTQVETKQGLTFGRALRALLRQDPDVILVGEIRDKETAEVAAQAAMTGHLVLATVHANDAVSAIQRLGDMGLHYSTIGQTLRGALAQRLLRCICSDCAEPVGDEMTEEEARLSTRHAVKPLVRAVGCPGCGFSGYRGRLPCSEVMISGPRFKEAVEQRKGWATLSHLAVQGGMRTMHEVALDWVERGKTTLVEVERVLGQEFDEKNDESISGPPRILLVDDDEDARVLMRTLLETEEFEVHEAETGEEALEILSDDPAFSLCILDLRMPGMDGRQTLYRIRDSADTVALPVLIRTGTGSDQTETELLEAGADDYVDKAVEPARFMARVKAILRRSLI